MTRKRTGVLGTYRLLKDDPTELYRRIGWDGFVLRKAGFRRFGTVTHSDAIRQVLVTNADNYVKTPIARALLEPLLGRGLLTSEGDFWRRQRRIQAPAFHHQRIRPGRPVGHGRFHRRLGQSFLKGLYKLLIG